MAERAVLIVSGNVQNVGYRALVKQVSRNLGIRGKVRNLDDGKVKIWCEAENRGLIETMKEAIAIKSRRDGPFILNVDEMVEIPSGTPGHGELEKYGPFEIDYGPKLDVQKEQMASLEIAKYALFAFKNDTKDSFEDLGMKYHAISNTINKTFYVIVVLAIIDMVGFATVLVSLLKAS